MRKTATPDNSAIMQEADTIPATRSVSIFACVVEISEKEVVGWVMLGEVIIDPVVKIVPVVS